MFSSTKKPKRSKLPDTECGAEFKEAKKIASRGCRDKAPFRPSFVKPAGEKPVQRKSTAPPSQTHTTFSLARSTADCTGMQGLQRCNSPQGTKQPPSHPNSQLVQSFFKNGVSSSSFRGQNKPLVPMIDLAECERKPIPRSKSVANAALVRSQSIAMNQMIQRGKSNMTPMRKQSTAANLPRSSTQLYPFKILKQWEKQSGKLWSNLTHLERKSANLQISEMLRQRNFRK